MILICKICKSEYEGHFNSKCCSDICRKKAKSNTNKKYNSKYTKKQQKIIDEQTLQGETWKPVNLDNYKHIYEISNKGRVRSKVRKGGGCILKQSLSTEGYYMVNFRNKDIDNKTHAFSIHRLIGLTYIDNPDNLPCIDHINRIRTDNRIKNLRWASYQTNANNRFVKGSILIRKDKCKLSDGSIKIYKYYRASFRKGLNKSFKNKKDAEKWLEEQIKLHNRNINVN